MSLFGKYESVNKLPHFATKVAEHGLYDPTINVSVRLAEDGRYTIDGVNAYDKEGVLKYGLDLKFFINNVIDGVYYTSNGLLVVDLPDAQHAVYISDAGGYSLPYSILTSFKDSVGNHFMPEINIPSDHPFLQAFISV